MHSNLRRYKASFNGDFLQPGDEAYVKNKNVLFKEGNPSAIVKPNSHEALIEAIALAEQQELPLAVRGGGHSGAGFGTNEGGLVIDMDNFRSIAIADQSNQIISVGAGATWEDAAKVLAKHKLAISAGDTKSVGVAGLTLSGGIGWLVRHLGAASDQLVGAEIITAQGEILYIRPDHHPDLFWAIKGGGGNFGVVTRLDFKAHHVPEVFFGAIHYSPADFLRVAVGWSEYMKIAPKELTTILKKTPTFRGRPSSLVIQCCYSGRNESAMAQAVNPLLALAPTLEHSISSHAYSDILVDSPPASGMTVRFNNMFVKTLSQELLERINGMERVFQLRSLGGTFRTTPNPGALGFRDCEALIFSPTVMPPHLDEATIQDLLAPWNSLAMFSQGIYSGLASDPKTPVGSMYPEDTLKRLAKVKATYDPSNIFQSNFTIPPASSSV